MRQLGIGLSGGRSINPALLFASSEQGVWYDPSDFSTMFQDSAGTTPVTAVEQPVGKILDKSGRGNHATQATSTKRPVLSQRYNIIDKSQDFSNAVWVLFGANVAKTPAYLSMVTPTGSSACRVQITASGSDLRRSSGSTTVGLSLTVQIKVKATGSDSQFRLNLYDSASGNKLSPDFTATSEWQTFTWTYAPTTGYIQYFMLQGPSVFASVDVLIGDCQIVPADQASLPYQRVNTATDYDTVGFKHYLKFDGVDDALATASINFTATDKMTVVAGVRKLSDAAQGMLVELTALSSSNTGSFWLNAPTAASPTYGSFARGDAAIAGNQLATASGYAAPISSVLACAHDIAGDLSTLRVNGVAATPATGDKGPGSFANAVLYIGSRGGTSLPFNGHLYSLIIRGAQSTDAQIVSAENYVNQRTGAY